MPSGKWRFLMRGVVLAVLGAAAPGALHAQSSVSIPGTCDTGTNRNADCRMSMTLPMSIVATRRLIVTPGATFALLPASGQLSTADYDAGMFNASRSMRVQVQSNAPYRVTVQAASGTLTGSCSSKSTGTILWGTSSATRTTTIAAAPTTVFSGPTFTTSEARDLFFRVSIGWLTDGPVAAANCTLPLTFSVGAP